MKAKYTSGMWDYDGQESLYCIFTHNETEADKYGDLALVNHNKIAPPEVAKANAQLMSAAPEMFEALIEISKGKGAYDLDPLQHAENCIKEMKEIALEAIKNATL